MSFVRPEVRAALARWRETLAGAAAALAGLWLVFNGYGGGVVIGWGFLVGGAALAVAGVQRARFRAPPDGPGIVRVDEGRVVYLGPFGGGSVALDRLAWLELQPSGRARPDWVLIEEDGTRLDVPSDAMGAEALFDVFAALPGLGTEEMLARLGGPVRERTPVWQRDAPRLH